MKTRIIEFTALIFILSLIVFSDTTAANTNRRAGQYKSDVPTVITENKGQWDENILFRASGDGATFWFTRDGIFCQFLRTVDAASGSGHQSMTNKLSRPDSLIGIVVKAEFAGRNPQAEVIGLGRLDYRCNYFLGNDPARWQRDVANYSGVTYKGIYPGIDIEFSFNAAGQAIYEYKIAEGADANLVDIGFQGAENVVIANDGRKVAETKWGDKISFDMPRLNSVGSIQEGVFISDDAADERPVYADKQPSAPLILEYSTFIGGSGYDECFDVDVDTSGRAYITGYSASSNYPRLNAYDSTFAGSWDVIVTAMSPDGSTIEYSTFIGGGDWDYAYSLAVDASGYAYVTGITSSSDFPTENAYDSGYNGGDDVFIAKLSPDGSALEYSTYLGGSDNDDGMAIAVDNLGYAYMTGYTYSSDFPTEAAYDGSLGGTSDVFITKLSQTGDALEYSTYLGGGQEDQGYGIAVNASGQIYVVGLSYSSDFPTVNSYDGSLGGTNDAFVTKFTADGLTLIYSTYLGGTDDDYALGLALDATGKAYVSGVTHSVDFPTENPYDSDLNGNYDAFVTKMSSSGTAPEYSTYLGGNDDDESWAVAVDALGCAYITGQTSSSDFPTLNAYDAAQNGKDAFVTKLSPGGDALEYSSFLGGTLTDRGDNIAVDIFGSAYVTGPTYSSDFPLENEYDGSFNGAYDVFISKLRLPFDQVQSTADAGVGSLRWSLENLNAIPGPDTITFAISGTITLASPLELTDDSTLILGGTAPGGARSVIIDGVNAYGIGMTGDHCLLRDIVLKYGTIGMAGQYDTVAGCFVGTDETGLNRAASEYGSSIFVNGKHNVIGGCAPEDRNVIAPAGVPAWQEETGVTLNNDSNLVIGNYIGINSSGGAFTPVYSHGFGITLWPSGPMYGNKIGDISCGNYIGGCTWGINGMESPGTEIIGNVFGLAANLSDTIPNNFGITLDSCPHSLVNNNIIDGSVYEGLFLFHCDSVLIGENTIAGNGTIGIGLSGSSPESHFVTITKNILKYNGGLGIDLGANGVTVNDPGDGDTGPNDLLNYPKIDSLFMNPDSTFRVYGTAADSAIIEFFVAHPEGDTTKPADPSGYGEAWSYIGSDTADNNGDFEYMIDNTVPYFSLITATATDTLGNTSEFAPNFYLIPTPLIIVGYSPINLQVIDPVGDSIGKLSDNTYFNTIKTTATYDDAEHDSITIQYPLEGEYIVIVHPQGDPPPGSLYSIGIRIDGSLQAIVVKNANVPASGTADTLGYEVIEGYHFSNGDASRDDTVNLLDVLYLIGYLYNNPPGPAPDPVTAGDANCDRLVNLIDILYLIANLYNDPPGPAPCQLDL